MQRITIIGAGPAGLTAAYELLRQSSRYEVVLLEESEQIGGISRTIQTGKNRMDIGGHRFFSKDERVVEWWNRFMPVQGVPAYDDKLLNRPKPLVKGGPDPEKEDRVMLIRDRVSRIYFRGNFYEYPITLKMETIKNMGLPGFFKAGFSYLKAAIFKKPEDSLENFYINRFGRVLYSMFFEGYTEKLWGRHPREISADWGAQRVKGLSVRAILKNIFGKILPGKRKRVETSLIEQFSYPKYGPGQLWETVASECIRLGAEIKTGCSVTGIELKNGKADTVCHTEKGSPAALRSDIVISTMPLKDLVLAMGDGVPRNVRAVAKGLPYRDFITVGLLVSKLDLINKTKKKTLGNIVPDCWIYVQEPHIKMGRLQIFNNWSPYMVEDPEHTVWIGTEYFCTENDGFWSMDEKEITEFAVNELVQMKIISKEYVIKSHCEKVKKAYPAYFDTYTDVDKAVDFINALGNVYCIGRNGQHRYNNMDHSMATAFAAVETILSGKEDKSDIWSVNTDEEYHETKG